MSKRFLRKIAGRGGNMRAYKLSATRRTAIARKAGKAGAKARWHKPTLIEVIGKDAERLRKAAEKAR